MLKHVFTGLLIVFVTFAAASSRLWSQENIPGWSANLDRSDPSSPLRILPFVKLFAVSGRTAFVCWPKEMVSDATITAIDLDTLQLKWKRVIGPLTVWNYQLFHNQLYYVASNYAPGRPSPPETSEECLLSLETGEGVPQSVDVPRSTVVSNDTYLVSNRIYSSDSANVIDLPRFHRWRGIINRKHLFEMGFACNDDGRITGERILRRIQLATGTVELTDELVASMGDLVTAWDNRVLLQYEEPIEKTDPPAALEQNLAMRMLVCYDLEKKDFLWKVAIPCPIRATRFRDDGLLECQCYSSSEIVAPNAPDRMPLLVDVDKGTFELDRDWHDPNALAYWYAGTGAITHAIRNDRSIVAVLVNHDMLCIDAISAKLLWRQTIGDWAHFTEILGERIVTSLPGAIEITDVATGTSRVIKAEDLGLQLIAAMKLPDRIPSNSSNEIQNVKSDWFFDRMLLALPALPLAVWIVYQLHRWGITQTARNRGASRHEGSRSP